jgi:hypothetical protein
VRKCWTRLAVGGAKPGRDERARCQIATVMEMLVSVGNYLRAVCLVRAIVVCEDGVVVVVGDGDDGCW